MVNYNAGLYILKIKTDKGLVTRKIVKIDWSKNDEGFNRIGFVF